MKNKSLNTLTCHQMRTLLKYYKKTLSDRNQEIITVRELETKNKDSEQALEIEIMFRQVTLEQLDRDIELVDEFMNKAKEICSEDDYKLLNCFRKGVNIERIGVDLSRSYHGVQYRLGVIIPYVLSEARNNFISDIIR